MLFLYSIFWNFKPLLQKNTYYYYERILKVLFENLKDSTVYTYTIFKDFYIILCWYIQARNGSKHTNTEFLKRYYVVIVI